ncbi:hypothetical protein [Amycolatopsis alkalitolerans]|uniref:Uncharacterized protein n=1 Tax=Amycolatopsis alkalitolerans TaxID=2547244 RepID=A0A5C4LSJ1_9PSEU|nr:hypothetical protein [Amycolatopsis alkalitolerans]TNC21401.1 hypothetical protein FG385_28150 [Amycolatopsis alkalitolerans]
MKITNLIGIPGTTLSCAADAGVFVGHGIGVPAGAPARLRHLADRDRVFGTEVVLADAAPTGMPTNKQPQTYVPHPPLERSP